MVLQTGNTLTEKLKKVATLGGIPVPPQVKTPEGVLRYVESRIRQKQEAIEYHEQKLERLKKEVNKARRALEIAKKILAESQGGE